MTARELKVARIGNSRGVRIPARTLSRYGIGDTIIMEERSDGILLRPNAKAPPAKLSWEETAREMAATDENWADWDATLADGLERAPWDATSSGRVAEPRPPYPSRRRPRGK